MWRISGCARSASKRYIRSYALPTDRLSGSLGAGRYAGRRSREDAALHAYDDDCGGGISRIAGRSGPARGIKYCEFTSSAVDAFLNEDVAAARRLIADLGLTPVSCGSVSGPLGTESQAGCGARLPKAALRAVFVAGAEANRLPVQHRAKGRRRRLQGGVWRSCTRSVSLPGRTR